MTFRELRERAGFNQPELARRAGIQQTSVSQLDRGKLENPTYATVEAVADALGTTPQVVMRAIRKTLRDKTHIVPRIRRTA